MPPKKRGKQATTKKSISTNQPTVRTPKKRRSKYLDINKFEWTEYNPYNYMKGFKTETDEFTGSITAYIYGNRTNYFQVSIIPKIGYNLPIENSGKWFNNSSEAITNFILKANSIVPNPEVKTKFEKMHKELVDLFSR